MTATESISPNDEERASVTDHVTSDGDVKSRLPPRSWGKGVQTSSRVTAKQDDCTVGDGHSSGSKWLNHDVEWARLSVNGVEDMNKAGVETRQKRAMSDESGDNCANANDTTCHVSGAEPISSEASTRQYGRLGLNSTKELLRKSSCTDSDVETSHEQVLSSPPSKRVSTIPSAKTSRTCVEVYLGKNSTMKITPPVIGSPLEPTDDGHISKYKVLNGLTTSITPQSSAEGSGIKRQPIQSQRSGLCDRKQQQIDTISNARISRMDEARDKDDRNFSSRATITKVGTTNEAKKGSFANAQILQVIYATDDEIARLSHSWGQDYTRNFAGDSGPCLTEFGAFDAESKLSLMISKNDFARMRVVGQFNLGFIIALRPRSTSIFQMANDSQDELLIIDQHASDEKFNFEKLQANTVVQSQRLVHPKTLVLTALEEEIVLQNVQALEANGFQVQVDVTGTAPVGSRCQLLALPLSRESTFTVKDLEDLISLLADEPVGSNYIPRPSAVRKMLAMRACRSSIMIGKALTTSQMSTIIRHMGELDKPWNCPHGRPTMRHLCRIQALREAQWTADTLGAVTTKSWATYTSYAGSGR
ncbi:hypothetical protein E4U30_006905 [Claviceps sp. LM220 group G6]|nr:hypothetical protein E4U15_006748 [Claviceps sp. LM218 group G6]KAG6090740.1 hypothetical protein E4U31_007758 [Claviceps sp. LM219 group G6]KAG6091451.1 hypothetical protein E4U30_006905 [Claviceps sp. LM220 group G6]KAG6093477.1 hypothetical protein E4U14_000289 [Claviceps sp. LM454 group G7]